MAKKSEKIFKTPLSLPPTTAYIAHPGASTLTTSHAPRPQPVTQKKLQILANVFAPVNGTPKQGFVSADQTPFASSQEAAAKVISAGEDSEECPFSGGLWQIFNVRPKVV